MAGNKTVAIIGGGMSGLTAAKLLCVRGVEVKLFEANGKVGGCCATTLLGDYTFNDGAIYLAMPGMLDHLFEALGLDRSRLLPLRRISAIQSTTLPDGVVVDIGTGPEVAIMSAQGAAATTRVQAEVEEFLKKWEPTLRFFIDDIMVHPLSLSHLLTKGWRHLAKLRGTAAAHLNSSFSSEAARAAFGGAMLYAGVSPDKQPAASLLGLVAMLKDGYFIPEGGMGRIPEVLSDAVQVQGGKICLNSNVRRILVKNGRAYAIEVENEGLIEVDAVISTVSAMHTYASLLSECDVPTRMMRKVRRAPLSHRGFVLQLGLANKIEARSHVNCVMPWLGEQSQVFQTSGDEMRWPTYTVPTVTLPELAPNGGSIVEMFPSISQELAPDDWSKARKEDLVARAVELLRRHHQIDIAVSRILSPREFQNDFHLYAGALYGLSPVAGPGALFKHRTPIRGLYQAGQTTWPGFGVVGAGMSGIFAAESLLRDESL
ncbi:MAG: phytoene desaturase family protein [Bacteroidota bacterium]